MSSYSPTVITSLLNHDIPDIQPCRIDLPQKVMNRDTRPLSLLGPCNYLTDAWLTLPLDFPSTKSPSILRMCCLKSGQRRTRAWCISKRLVSARLVSATPFQVLPHLHIFFSLCHLKNDRSSLRSQGGWTKDAFLPLWRQLQGRCKPADWGSIASSLYHGSSTAKYATDFLVETRLRHFFSRCCPWHH